MPDPVPLPTAPAAPPRRPPPPRALGAEVQAGRPLRRGRDRYLRVGARAVSLAVLNEIARLTDYDADGSQAKNSFVRLVNTGHTVAVRADDGTPLPESAAAVNALAKRAWELGGGGTDKLIPALLLRIWKEGGAGIEVEVAPDLTDVLDLHPFGRRDFTFRPYTDPVTGRTTLAKFANGAGVDKGAPVPRVQTPYQGLDVEGEENPYGTPPLLAAIDALEDLATFLDDTLAVIHTQGYGRPHITVDHHEMVALRPDLQGEELTAFLEDQLGAVRAQLEALNPEQWPITYAYIAANAIAPGDLGGNLAGIKDELVRRVATALKTIAVILGQNEGSTTTHATVQWSIYAKLLAEAQQMIQRLLEAAYNCCLRVWGLPGSAHVTFEAIRQTDRQTEATADGTEQGNARGLLRDGAMTWDEYTQTTMGRAPTDGAHPPPTAWDEFELQKLQTEAAVAGAIPPAGAAPTGTPAAGTPVAQPGTDAGLTAEEGAALDQAPTSLFAQWSNAPTIPELGDDAAAVLGAAAVEDLRAWFQHEAPGLLALLDAEGA